MSKTTTDMKATVEQADVHVETHGDLWRSFTGLLDPLVDEAKFRFSADDEDTPTLSVRAVDPANVGMASVNAPASAMEHYSVPEKGVYGLEHGRLTSITDYARKGGNSEENPGDPVLVQVVGRRVYGRVDPPDRWTRTGSFFTIDPDAIRQEPDLPDLNLPWRGRVDATNLRDAVHGLDSRFDYVGVRAVLPDEESGNGTLGDEAAAYLSIYGTNYEERDGERVLTDEEEFRTDERVLTSDDPDEDPATSLFSLDYLKEMTTALVSADYDRVKLHLGEDFPLRIRFGGGRFGINGAYLLAPRITKEDSHDRTDYTPTWGERFEVGE